MIFFPRHCDRLALPRRVSPGLSTSWGERRGRGGGRSGASVLLDKATSTGRVAGLLRAVACLPACSALAVNCDSSLSNYSRRGIRRLESKGAGLGYKVNDLYSRPCRRRRTAWSVALLFRPSGRRAKRARRREKGRIQKHPLRIYNPRAF